MTQQNFKGYQIMTFNLMPLQNSACPPFLYRPVNDTREIELDTFRFRSQRHYHFVNLLLFCVDGVRNCRRLMNYVW